MTTRQITLVALAALLPLAGCGSGSVGSNKGTGGATGSGGATRTGGATGTGGGTATGGATGTGGATPTGGATGTGGATTGTGGTNTTGGTTGTGGVTTGTGGAGGSSLTADQVRIWAEAYKAAHPGNGGKDWDIISCCAGASRTPAQIAADPAAQQLLSVCGTDQRPIIPLLAWEYGGSDHAWINPQASAVAYCVYIPAVPSTSHWQYDATADHVTADVFVRFPDQNPCNNQVGANQVLNCLGDATNIQILVDTASLRDGADVGLSLANSSTDLNLIMPDGTKVHLFTGL
jgi:hypothetical protein